MRKYVEAQAAAGDFTASEYVRHLIRLDQETRKRRAQIAQYLELCEQQIARGEVRELDMDGMLAEFERSYKKRRSKSAKA